MKTYKLIYALLSCGFALMLSSCTEEGFAPRNNSSIIPSTTNGRTNKSLGTLYLSNRKITIKVWDHGQIDEDKVSIYVNGSKVISNRTLRGPSSKITATTTLDYKGYNYICLYAHNLGDIPPNTAAISIDDGTGAEQFTLQANLDQNGAYNLVVD